MNLLRKILTGTLTDVEFAIICEELDPRHSSQSLCKSDEYCIKSVLYTSNTLENYNFGEFIYELRWS